MVMSDVSETDLAKLWQCLQNDDEEGIKTLYSSNPAAFEVDLGHNNNAIKAASYLSDISTVKLLLSLGLSPDAVVKDADDHWTALHHACKTNKADMVAVLLTSGADPRRTWQGQSCEELTTSDAIKLILQVHMQKLAASTAE
eukprot:m.85861 g.85861  ORF g.85861 m.85861 type:complete len:142 (+) comp14743_c0_seq3:88-513(+)